MDRAHIGSPLSGWKRRLSQTHSTTLHPHTLALFSFCLLGQRSCSFSFHLTCAKCSCFLKGIETPFDLSLDPALLWDYPIAPLSAEKWCSSSFVLNAGHSFREKPVTYTIQNLLKRLLHVFQSGEFGGMELGKQLFFIILHKNSEDKEMIDTFDCIKIKKVCSSKDIKTINRQTISWKKTFAVTMSNQRLVSRIWSKIYK